MNDEKIIYNGKPQSLSEIGFDINKLLSSNYIYQQIHVHNFCALHLSIHLEIADNSFQALFGRPLGLSLSDLQGSIDKLVKVNSLRDCSYAIRLYLFGDGYLISCYKQLLYRGYVYWHSRPDALITPYENPFFGHPNASSLISAEFAAEFVRRSGTDNIALTENYDGILVGVGDNPLFALKEGIIWTTPIKYGATDSVERRKGIEAAVVAEFDIVQQPLLKSDISTYEELFTIDTQGVTSIFSCNGTSFFSMAAERIAKCLSSVSFPTRQP